MHLRNSLRRSTRLAVLLCSAVLLAACSNGGGNSGPSAPARNSYSISGTVSGLSGSVVLQNNGGDNLTVSTNGPFTFGTKISDASGYNVTVLTPPASQTCTVSNGAGTVSGGNVTNINVVCASQSFTVGGTVSGLSGAVVLQNNGGNDLSITANGPFTFTSSVANSGAYNVTVLTQPSGQNCSIANGSGSIAGANVSNVSITCAANSFTVGGSVTGLLGSVVLQNNGTNDFTVSANGPFVLPNTVTNGSAYAVNVLTQPTGQVCTVTNGTGTISGASVSNVAIGCVKGTAARYVLVAHTGDNSVSTYVVDGTTGRLKWIARTAVGVYPQELATDPLGRYAYVLNYTDGTISQFTIAANGKLTPMSVPTITPAAGSAPYSIAIDPLSRYAYVTDAGPGAILQYSLGADGGLVAMNPDSVSSSSNPYSIAIDPSGKYVYVANALGNSISQFTIGATGALTPMSPAFVTAGTNPYSVIVDPTGKYVYAANWGSGNVSQYSISASGALVAMTPATVAAGTNAASLAIDPAGKYLYVGNRGSNNISQYTIGTSGSLTPMTAATAASGTTPIYVTVDAMGKYAYATNYAGNSVSLYLVGSDGSLTAIAPTQIAAASGPRGMAVVSGSASAQVVPKNAYATNSTSNNVSQYTIGTDGTLTAMATPTVPAGSITDGIAVDPSRRYAYVANYGSNTVAQYTVGTDGSLAPMNPATVAAGTNPTYVAIDPTGRYVYVSNNSSTVNTVSQFAIGVNGALTPLVPATVGTGTTPQQLTVHPSGRFAYVANYGSSNVSQYTISASGSLAAMTPATVPVGLNPGFVGIDPSGRYAYVTNINANTISQFSIGANGNLTALIPATVATGTAPERIAIDPAAKYAYVTNYIGGSISQYTVGLDGTLTPMGTASVSTGGGTPFDITVDASGRYVYATPGGATNGANNVLQFAIGTGGALTPLTPATVPAGTGPGFVTTTETYR